MNQRIKKILSISLITLLVYIPIISFADNQEISESQIVKVDDGKCIIYLEDLQNQKFNYSISSNKDNVYDNLNSFASAEDTEKNQVIVIEKEDFNFEKNEKAYLKINLNNQIQTVEIDFSKAITKQELENVETTCNRIQTEILSGLNEEDFTDENGVHKMLNVGGIKIKNDGQYFYDIKNANDTEIMKIVEKINNNYQDMDMYNKIKISKEFNEQYNLLVNNAEWKQVNENTIRQPKDAEENSEYIVLIKNVQDNNVITDIKFLRSIEDQNEAFENEKISVQETSKLPITGDSLILIIAFALIFVALIFTFIKMRKNHEKENN